MQAWPRPSCRHLLAVVALALALLAPGAAYAVPVAPDALHAAMESAIQVVKPALVRIHVVSVDYYDGRESKSESFGSGVIIGKEGYVITNHHVAGDAKYLSCTMADKEEIEADLVGTDPLTDIAVIKLRPETPCDFPFATFGDSDAVQVGDRVFAMGSPLAFSQSVTMGVVSNTELVMPDMFPDDWLTLDGENVGSVVRWIAHDARIYGGNSGGPLVDAQGRIIGINEISFALSGAIPGNLAAGVAKQLIAQGKVRRSGLGIAVQPLLKSEQGQHGVLLTDVMEDSPAGKAGLQPGDILLRLHGNAVDVRYREELPLFNQMILSLPIGTPVQATVLRNGQELALTLTPEERKELTPKPREFKEWGLCLTDLNPVAAQELGRPSTAGVRVYSLRSGGSAQNAKPALQADDVIVAVAGKPVNSVEEFRQASESLLAGKTDEQVPVLVAYERGRESCLTVVKVGIPEINDPGKEVRKAWAPFASQVLTRELADALGVKGRTGIRITQVYPNTTAEQAGLQVGDVIVELDGIAIPASQPEDTEVFPAMVRQYRIGSTVELTVIRGADALPVTLTLAAAPKLPRELKEYQNAEYEFSGRDIAFSDRVRQGLADDQAGVLIESVREGGWGSLGHLSAGDLLVAVNGTRVDCVDTLDEVMTRLAAAKPRTIVLQVKRQGRNAFVELHATWPK